MSGNTEVTIYNSLEDAVYGAYSEGVDVIDVKQLFGGDANVTFRLGLSNGEKAFIKCNSPERVDMFINEAFQLECLRKAEAVKIPEAYAVGRDEGREISFLLMEFVESDVENDLYWERFGRALARMHRTDTSSCLEGGYGFSEDTYLGRYLQDNTPADSFPVFFRDNRLSRMYDRVKDDITSSMKNKLFYIMDHIEAYLPEPDFPSLVHGDMWRGNVMCGRNQTPWLVDPACHVSFFETDLAMSELFGRFPERFYDAYSEVNPIDPEYNERKGIYDLYHILNHVHHFGESYMRHANYLLDYYAPGI